MDIERYSPSADYGLTDLQVQSRIDANLTNAVSNFNSQTVGEIIFKNLFTYFNLIFAILAALLILTGNYKGLTFMPIVIANTLIGIVQQIRSKRTLDKLSMLHAPKARVMRDGKISQLRAEETVLDDVALFSAGNQIYADAIILDGEVLVNESLLTGEADEILKHSGDMLMSGSFIISGECRARLDKVGDNSYIAKLSAQAKQIDTREHSKMLYELNRLIKFVGIAIIPIGIIMFCEQFFYAHLPLQDCVSAMVAALLGMIPEGLYLLTTVALALSVMRLAHSKVLVHDMSCVETLARVDVLCLDKTGTITENTMKLNKLIPLNGTDENEFSSLVGCFAASMNDDSTTISAIKNHFGNNYKKAEKIFPFSSSNKFSAATIDSNTYILGAAEFVLGDDFKLYRDVIEANSRKGRRVLVFARYCGNNFKGRLTDKVQLLGLIILQNKVRKNCSEIFGYFYSQGVDIKVISGDNPITVSEIAKEADIKNWDKYVDTSTLTDEEIPEAAKTFTVFGRVTPQMKRKLVHALQADGKTVAMTGDGVNDVLALKDADCSIAMATGSEAAQQVSQLVLLDSDFSHMPQILHEGRRVVNNIERSAGLFLIKNIFSFLLALFAMLTLSQYPLEPSQVSLINAFTIGIPAFLLALEKNNSLIKGSFIKNIVIKALPAALTNFLTISALIIAGRFLKMSDEAVSTVTTLTLAAVGFMVLFKISRPFNRYKAILVLLMPVGLYLSAHYFRGIFELQKMDSGILIPFAIFSVLAFVLYTSLTFALNMIEIRFSKK